MYKLLFQLWKVRFWERFIILNSLFSEKGIISEKGNISPVSSESYLSALAQRTQPAAARWNQKEAGSHTEIVFLFSLRLSFLLFCCLLFLFEFAFCERKKKHVKCNRCSNSPVPELSFLPSPYRGWTWAGERRVQDNLHAHAQNAAIFSPQIGGKTIFGSIFQIWLVARFWVFWMIIYKQQFLHSDWLKTCQLIPDQWNFISATLNHIRFVFFFLSHYQGYRKKSLPRFVDNWKHQLGLESARAVLCKWATCTRQTFLSKNFAKSLNIQKQYEKNVREKSNDAYSLCADHDKPYFNFYVLMFFMSISTWKKMFSFRARAEKGIARHIDASSVVGTW